MKVRSGQNQAMFKRPFMPTAVVERGLWTRVLLRCNSCGLHFAEQLVVFDQIARDLLRGRIV